MVEFPLAMAWVFRRSLCVVALVSGVACSQAGPSTSGGADPADAGTDTASTSSSGSSSSSGNGSSSSGGADAGFPSVPVDALYIQPRDGSDFVTDLIGSAQTSVELVTYILTSDDVEAALAAAVQRGVSVRVMLDGDQSANNAARTFLNQRNVPLRNGPAGFVNYHQKTVVVDNSTALIMTLNPSFSAFNSNREYAVRVTRPAEVADLTAIFNADWDSRPNPVLSGNLVVSPNNARSRLLLLINRARTQIDVSMEVFSDSGLIAALKTRKDAGMVVRVVMAHPSDVDQNAADALDLINKGFEVRFLRNPTMHAKLMVVDSTLAYVGSVNFTRTSLDLNREVGVLVDQPAIVQALKAQADADFAAGVVP